MTKIRKRGSLSAFFSLALLVVTTAALLGASPTASAQDWVRTGTNLGAAKIRIAAADFAPAEAKLTIRRHITILQRIHDDVSALQPLTKNS